MFHVQKFPNAFSRKKKEKKKKITGDKGRGKEGWPMRYIGVMHPGARIYDLE